MNDKINLSPATLSAAAPLMPPVVLTFAGSDPTCGAGVQADIMTLAAIGCHPATVITVLTVQDTVGVAELHGMNPELIAHQAQTVLEDLPVAAFKLGLLGGVETIRLLGDLLEEYDDVPLIFDPVLASGAGDDFVNDEIMEAIFEEIIPQTTMLTPNIHEARRLVAFIDRVDAEHYTVAQCAERLIHHGCEYVLITGTHAPTHQVDNALFQHEKGHVLTLSWPRLPATFHGSGCTLASAIAGYIAHGIDVLPAVKLAQEFTWQSLNAGYRIGMGRPVPNRFYWRNEPLGEPLNVLKDRIEGETKLEESYPGH